MNKIDTGKFIRGKRDIDWEQLATEFVEKLAKRYPKYKVTFYRNYNDIDFYIKELSHNVTFNRDPTYQSIASFNFHPMDSTFTKQGIKTVYYDIVLAKFELALLEYMLRKEL